MNCGRRKWEICISHVIVNKDVLILDKVTKYSVYCKEKIANQSFLGFAKAF